MPTSYNEDALIATLTKDWCMANPVIIGPGDDCAVLFYNKALYQLFKTDVVVEGHHFLPSDHPERIGWKALARNVSDIAAMGGYPESALITLILPNKFKLERIQKIYRGIQKAADAYEIQLAGGETSRGTQLILSIAMIGLVEKKRLVLRTGAQTGDFIFVSGKLGGSRAGKHLDFIPRLKEARWLGSHFKPTSMMDLSDGLASDLPRLARASEKSFQLDLSKIPTTPHCSLKEALADGEDYELLFTIPPMFVEKLTQQWSHAFPKTRLTAIGRMDEPDKTNTPLPHGFDHLQL